MLYSYHFSFDSIHIKSFFKEIDVPLDVTWRLIMTEQILFYTKIILIKQLSQNRDTAKNQLIRYEPIHHAGDKEYKMVQYRKLDAKDTHQLIFVNQTAEYLKSCFANPDSADHFSFGFQINDVISVSSHTIMPNPDPAQRYLYLLKDYIPFNSNDYTKWIDGKSSRENMMDVLGNKLTHHIARLLNLLGTDDSFDLTVELYDETVVHDIAAYKSTGFSYFDLVFASNMHIPDDLNIGRRAATNGILSLLNK